MCVVSPSCVFPAFHYEINFQNIDEVSISLRQWLVSTCLSYCKLQSRQNMLWGLTGGDWYRFIERVAETVSVFYESGEVSASQMSGRFLHSWLRSAYVTIMNLAAGGRMIRNTLSLTKDAITAHRCASLPMHRVWRRDGTTDRRALGRNCAA